MRILLIFIDGLGIGENNKFKNPCALPGIHLFNNYLTEEFPKQIPYDGIVKPIDCSLGVKGLPQSATGQTALFTGKNAAQILGRHVSAFPNQKLRTILAEHSLFQKIVDAGKTISFSNAYLPIFFERGPEALLKYLSVTSILNWKAGLKFHNLDDLRNGKCIYHDLTNQEIIKKGFDIPQFQVEKAGHILADISKNHDFVLYEYFKTDRAGHEQDLDEANNLLAQLEQLVLAIISKIDLSETLLILTSDHGNIEDISIKHHTKNSVPLMAWGNHKKEMLSGVESILHVGQNIFNLLTQKAH